MKKTKIIVPALAMLLLGTAASVTGTVAWFSMNTSVTVTGMEVKTKVSSNLLIAGDTLDSTAKKSDNLFEAGLIQSVKGYLEPVSSVNGTSFFYTLNARANGSKIDGNYVQYDSEAAADNTTTYANKFSEDYGVAKSTVTAFASPKEAAEAYVDYVFQLKAVATEANSYINLKKLYLVDGNSKDTSKAHRIALFVEDVTGGTATAGPGTLRSIFTEAGATNFTADNAVASTTALGAVTYNGYSGDTTLATISAVGAKYYKVVVRMWLEGEDTTCYNDMFLPLTNSWKLDLELNLSTTNTEKAANISKLWYAQVETAHYYYDGTNVYTAASSEDALEKAKKGEDGSAIASAAAAVQTAFGYTPAP